MEISSLLMLSAVILALPGFRKVVFACGRFQNILPEGKRIKIFDFIKGLAILGVIIIHVSWIFVISEDLVFSYKLFAWFLNNISRFAIAAFFITSGILLRPVDNFKDYRVFLRDKLFSVFLPYILVSFFYGLYSGEDLLAALFGILTGSAALPYYFVVILFQFYLLYPLLLRYVSKELLYASFFLSLASFLWPASWALWGAPLFFKYFFFFVYGIANRGRFKASDRTPEEKNAWLCLLFLYVLLLFFLPAYYFNIRLIYGIAAFNLIYIFRRPLLKNRFISRPLVRIGRSSLWIFLLHYPVLEYFYRLSAAFSLNFYLRYLLVLISSFAASLIIAFPLSFMHKKLLLHAKKKIV